MYRSTALAFLLLNATVRNVIAAGFNPLDNPLPVATTATSENGAFSTSNFVQPTSAISGSQIITHSSIVAASASSSLSERPPGATNHAATLDLSTSFRNKTFLPLQVDGHEVPISCIDCSTTGTIHVTGSELSLNNDLIGGNDTNPFDGGSFTALLPHGLQGRIELGLSAPSTLSHTFNLTKFPITGFAIPGVADAGVTVGIGIRFSLELSKPSDVSFGFEFDIPQNSSILIDLANEENSSVHGFDNDNQPTFNILPVNDKQLKLNVLPVNVSDPSLDVKLSAALFLDLTIGADLHDSDAVAEIGAQLVIPVMVEERQLSHVDSKCNPLDHPNTTHITTQQTPSTTAQPNLIPRSEAHDLLGNYTNLIPLIGMELDVFVVAGLQDSFGGHDLAFNTGFQIFKTASMLPTTCINNHKTTSATTNTATTTTQLSTNGASTIHGKTGGSPTATTSSAAAAGLPLRESGEAFYWIGSSTGLALAIAVGWLVINF